MDIKDYLVQVAEEVTNRPLPDFQSLEEFMTWRNKKQTQFQTMLGIDYYLKAERTPLNVQVTGTLKRDAYRIEKIYFESLPGVYVTGNLYVPHELKGTAPGIIYLCGHSKTQKVQYQDHPRKFAQLGFVTLILDTIQLGEVPGIHHGTHGYGWFQWISIGYTPAAVEVWNAIRGVDLLSELEEVDPERIGMTGNSGGGSISWWAACADDRIKVVSPSCGTGTIASHVREKTIDRHCDCVFPSNPYGWSLIESGALVAPRPLLIVTPDSDELFNIESVRMVFERMQPLYKKIGNVGDIGLMEFHGPHSYSSESRKAIFRWFLHHLMDPSQSWDSVSDVDGIREEEKDLLVFNEKPPANDESTTVQDWFIPQPSAPVIMNKNDLNATKRNLVHTLRKESFATFPEQAPDLDIQMEQQSLNGAGHWIHKFSYVTERNWRVWGEIRGHGDDASISAPTAIALRTPGDSRGDQSIQPLQGLGKEWLRARIDPRGTGDTSWAPERSWHLRRSAALTGRTIASLRVWDALRGIQTVKAMPEVDSSKVLLYGKGEMAVVALYAAFLEGNVSGVILQDPPPSQNIPGLPDGTDSVIEIISALRHTDLPQVAGMLWPMHLIFVGGRPQTYRWAEELYQRLGEPGGVWRVKSISEWPGR